MNPILAQALGSIVRWALALGAGYLIKAGIWSASDAEVYITGGTLALVALAWSVWQKYHSRLKLVTALAMSATTEQNVEQQVKAGVSAPVTTPKHVTPLLTVDQVEGRSKLT